MSFTYRQHPQIMNIQLEAKRPEGVPHAVTVSEDYDNYEPNYGPAKSFSTGIEFDFAAFHTNRWRVVIDFSDGSLVIWE